MNNNYYYGYAIVYCPYCKSGNDESDYKCYSCNRIMPNVKKDKLKSYELYKLMKGWK